MFPHKQLDYGKQDYINRIHRKDKNRIAETKEKIRYTKTKGIKSRDTGKETKKKKRRYKTTKNFWEMK